MAMWTRRRRRARGGGWSFRRGLHTAAAGFTLLEVMVALAIVALVLMPLIRLHLLSLDATVRAQDLTTAVLLAQGHLTSLGDFPEEGEDEGTFEEPELAKYRWQQAVTAHTLVAEDGTNIDVRRIEVTIRWAEGAHERHYTLESYASR
jgi:type II secretion system protein I